MTDKEFCKHHKIKTDEYECWRILAAIILQLISTGLNLMRLDTFMVTAMWGAIIIFVLFGREFLTKGKAFLVARKSSHRRAKGETL